MAAPRLRTPSLARRMSGQPALIRRTPTNARALSAGPVRATPSGPMLAGVRPERRIATPTVKLKAPSGVGVPKGEDKGLLGGLRASIGNIVSFPGTVIKALPTIIGKAGQTAFGLGETGFDIVADIINPKLYTSRSEVDLAKGRALGLKGPELLAYSMQRTAPFFAPIVESLPKTAGRLAEVASPQLMKATGLDFGERGFDYYNALRRGQAGTMLLEDLGNIILLGRTTGAGNLGVRAGERIAAAGMPGLGRATRIAGRFAEEPIGTSVRGAARLAGRAPSGLGITPGPRLAAATAMAQRISESERPLLTAAKEGGRSFRNLAERKVGEFDVRRAKAFDEKIAAETAGRIAEAEAADVQVKRMDQKRSFWLRLSESAKQQRDLVRRQQIAGEAVATTFPQMVLRYEQLGSVPEAPQNLRASAERIRAQAQQVQEPARKASLEATADFLDRRARVKETGDQTKMADPQNRRTNFSAAVIVTSKLIDVIMRDREAGKSLDQIMETVQPKELLPMVEEQGYAYTKEAVQRAIDFVEGRLDEVDVLDMDVASQMLNSVAQYLEVLATQPGTLVSGVLSPAQFGDTPIPEIVVEELKGLKFAGQVINLLDEQIPSIVDEGFPELIDTLGDQLQKPSGLFVKFAGSRPDSPQYEVAYAALRRVSDMVSNPTTSVFSSQPRVARQVAEFFARPSIYGARMRPMMAYRESVGQQARAEDVNNALYGLKQLIDQYGDVLPSSRATRLQKLLDELAKPRREFDADLYVSVQNFLNQVLGDLSKRTEETGGKLGDVGRLIGESEGRIAEIEAQARAAAGMVEQALMRPEELTVAPAGDSRALRDEATQLESEAARLSRMPDPATPLRVEINVENSRLAKLKQDEATSRQRLDEIRTRLAEERRILNEAAMNPDEIVVFLAEVDAAVQRQADEAAAEPSLTDQKAWKQDRIDERQAQVDVADNAFRSMFSDGDIQRIASEDFFVEDYWAPLSRVLRNDRHIREFFKRVTRSKYEGVELPSIPKKADRKITDRNIGKPENDAVYRLDEALQDSPVKYDNESAFVEELAKRWRDYMEAVDALTEMQKKPFKSGKTETVSDAMRQERQTGVENQQWENPVTGEIMYGIRPLELLRRIEQMLANPDALAEQVRIVEDLRRQEEMLARSVQQAGQRTRDLDARLVQLTDRVSEVRGESPKQQAGRLVSRAKELKSEADRIDAATARLVSAAPRERLMLTGETGRRQRVATPKLTETVPKEVVGYEFTKGVARKLDKAETEELRQQQKLVQKQRKLQSKYNQEDAALGEAQTVQGEAAAYQGVLNEPTVSAVLAGVNRPRLMGETEQPTWIPVGEAAGVLPVAAMDTTMRGQGIAPETKLSIERQRRSTFMAQTPEQFAARVKDILKQVSRNRVVSSIIENEMLVSDVEATLGPTIMSRIQDEAAQAVDAQNIPRNTKQFERLVQEEMNNRIIIELDRMGYEPVSPVRMPEEEDPFAGRAPLGTFAKPTKGVDITPQTLVMRRGMVENLQAYFEPKGGTRIPPKLAGVFDFVQNKTASWKSVVLPFSVRWQVGDAMGNIINAQVRGGISPAELAQRIVEVSGRLRQPEGLTRRQLVGRDVLNTNVADPVIQVLLGAGLQARGLRLSDLRAMMPEKTLRSFPDTGIGGRFFFPRFREKSFAFNETQNTMVRSAVAILKLEEALTARGRNIDEIDPITVHNDPVLYEAVRDAVDQANEVLGNFSQLDPFEKQVIRTVYPFWSWVKFINKAAGELLLSKPDAVLFYGHLGSLATGDDGEFLYDWLRNQTPINIPGIGNVLVDLSFTNPYADAVLFGRNPAEETAATFTNVSPILGAGLKTAGELTYGASGRRFPLFEVVSRPGYLEGRPEATTRGFGDVLGGVAYQNFRTFAGPYRFLTDVAPTWRVPGTDVTLGPGPRYPQGSVRTSGVYGRPLLSPTVERIGSVLQGLGIPVPSATLKEAQAQGRDISRLNREALIRRQKERRLSRIGR